MADNKILKVALGLGALHLALHYVGFNYLGFDAETNYLYFVTPGLVAGYYYWRTKLEQKYL